jgi:hypothetical protein
MTRSRWQARPRRPRVDTPPERVQSDAPPELLALLFGTQVLEVPQPLAWAWWQALQGSPKLSAFTLWGLLYSPCVKPLDVEKLTHLFTAQLPPARLVHATEDLVEEGRLSRQAANVVEERVLTYTTKSGQWTFIEGHGTLPPFAHAAKEHSDDPRYS